MPSKKQKKRGRNLHPLPNVTTARLELAAAHYESCALAFPMLAPGQKCSGVYFLLTAKVFC
jgi:hypothetical protein